MGDPQSCTWQSYGVYPVSRCNMHIHEEVKHSREEISRLLTAYHAGCSSCENTAISLILAMHEDYLVRMAAHMASNGVAKENAN